jgi:hypothetical protein
MASDGYLYRTWYSEYTRYFVNVMSWHNHSWYYYFWNWHRLEFFTPYVFALPIAISAGLISRAHREMTTLLPVHAFTFVAILSYPIVKLMWYDAPVYPLLALMIGVGTIVLWSRCESALKLNNTWSLTWLSVLLILLFAIPVRNMYHRNAALFLPVDILEREGFFVRQLHHESPELKDYKILMQAETNAHYTQIDFYVNAYSRYEGYSLDILQDTSMVAPGYMVACCQEEQMAWLRQKFELKELKESEIGCVLVEVGARKN